MNAIFIILNSNHFNYAIACLNSILYNWPNHPKILCHYDNDLNNEQINQLKKYSSLELIPLKLENNEIGLCPYYRNNGMLISYAKLKLFSENYNEYDNILYLDVDTLVLNPLDELMAQKEFTIFRAAYKFEFLKTCSELRNLLIEDNISKYFNEDFKYFGVCGNSGIWLIPKNIRNKENYESILNILDRYKKYDWWPDQSTINLWMLKHDITPRDDIEYNFVSILFDKTQHKLEDLNLIHFIMKKPDEPDFLEWELIQNLDTRIMLKKLYDYYANSDY